MFTGSPGSVYRRDAEGRYRFQSVEEKVKVHSEDLPAASGEQVFRYTPKDYGRYQVVIRDAMEKGVQASLSFYASGWGYAPWAMDNPDKVQLTLEKSSYRAGETAKVQIKAPFAGKALVTVDREKVYSYQMIDQAENTGWFHSVKEEYLPNAYVTVHLIRRPATGIKPRQPGLLVPFLSRWRPPGKAGPPRGADEIGRTPS